MKRTMLSTMLALMLMTGTAHAKQLSDVTAHDVAMVSYKAVRLVLKTAAAPFYWLEKVADKKENIDIDKLIEDEQ